MVLGLVFGSHRHDKESAPSLGSFWSCSYCCSWSDVDDDNEITKKMVAGS